MQFLQFYSELLNFSNKTLFYKDSSWTWQPLRKYLVWEKTKTNICGNCLLFYSLFLFYVIEIYMPHLRLKLCTFSVCTFAAMSEKELSNGHNCRLELKDM
jgi:hypothetical protein